MRVLYNTSDMEVEPISRPYDDTIPFNCCGGRYVTTTSDFNDLTEVPIKDHWNARSLMYQFNRGILIGRNIDESSIIPSENSTIESFVVDGEKFFVRIRK